MMRDFFTIRPIRDDFGRGGSSNGSLIQGIVCWLCGKVKMKFGVLCEREKVGIVNLE